MAGFHFNTGFWKKAQGGLPYTPPLDAANAAAAYSVRKLRTAYTGPCIRISDNFNFSGATKDVGFDSNGYLDISELYTSSYVRTWYDQTGNGLDLVSNVVGSTPIIQLSGVLSELNGKAALPFDNDFMTVLSSTASFKFLHDGTKSQIVSVNQFGFTLNPAVNMHWLGTGSATAEVGVNLIYFDSGANDAYECFVYRGVGGTWAVRMPSANGAVPAQTQLLLWNEFDADNATAADRFVLQVNNGSLIKTNISTLSVSAANASRNLVIGRNANTVGFPVTGYMQEIIIYGTDQSANKATLQSNINSYFSIY